jgi:putative salt-induced outer membrane protein
MEINMTHRVKNTAKLILASAITLSAQSGLAAEWLGEAELGYVMKDGNSDSSTLNSKLKLSRESAPWKHTLRLEASNSSSATTDATTGEETTIRSAEKYVAEAKTDYKFTKKSYMFALANYQEDKFSGFAYEGTLAAGYGREVIKNDTLALSFEAGPGYHVVELDNGIDEEDAIIRLGQELSWKISETAKFKQSLTVEDGEENTVSEFKASLTSNLVKDFALKLGYAAKYTQEVPLDKKHADTETTITLVYSF